MINQTFFKGYHPEWETLLNNAFAVMDQDYLRQLQTQRHWLPSHEQLLSAFSLPLSKTNAILLGESPYPRAASANGYAFWDNAVGCLWSQTGLSLAVNKATSLRNFIKMLLVARGNLTSDLSQEAIAALDKHNLIQTAEQLFSKMMQHGILLLNACLVYSEGQVPYHSRQWKPFMQSLFDQLAKIKPSVTLILFGRIAQMISQDKLPVGLVAEHPYNVSFITNQQVIHFFNPLDLLSDDTDRINN